MTIKEVTLDTNAVCVSDIVGRITNIEWVWLQAKSANVGNILWGSYEKQAMEIMPGGSVILPFKDIGTIYVKAASSEVGLSVAVRNK